MAEFAGITLGVDVRQVDQGTKSLQEFKRANEQAAAGVSEFVNAELVAKNQARDTARYLSEQRSAFQSLQSAIDPTASKLRKLQDAASSLDKAFSAGVVPEAEFYRLGEALETQTNRLIRSRSALTEEGRAAIEAAKNKESAERQAQSFIRSLQAQADAATLSRDEFLKLRAAQLGVSDQAAPIIDRITQASSNNTNAIANQSRAFQAAGISAGQYNQALRFLPVQINDITSSIANGMPLFMVLTQQIPQITDSFGGFSNTLSAAQGAVIDYVSSIGELRSSFADVKTLGDEAILRFGRAATIFGGAIVASLAVLGKAAYDSFIEVRQLNNAIIETGRSSTLSVAAIKDYADQLNETSRATKGSIGDIYQSLVSNGRLTVSQINLIAKSVANLSAVSSRSAESIISDFDKIAKDPVKGLIELDKQFNFLSEGQLTLVNNLKETEGQTAAVTAALEIFAARNESVTKQIEGSLTPLELAWGDFRKFVSDTWDAIGDRTIGALNLFTDVIAATIERIRLIIGTGDKLINDFVIRGIEALQKIPGASGVGNGIAEQLRKDNDAIEKENIRLAKSIADRDARVRRGETGYLSVGEGSESQTGTSDRDSESRRKALADEIKAIEERSKKTKSGAKEERDLTISYESGVLALQAQLKVLQEHRQISDVISNERKQLFAEEAKFAILNERLADGTITKQQRSLLLQQDKILGLAREKAEIGDQIVLQERANKLLDDNIKKTRQINAEAASISVGAGLSQREAERRRELAALEAQQISKGGSVDDTDFQALLQARQNFYNQEDALRGNWLAGVKSAFAETADELANFNQIGSELAMSAFNGLTDQITNLVTTGEASFREFTASILKQIARIATQLLLIKAIESTISSFGGSGGAIGSIGSAFGFASGGYTGNGGKYEPAGTVHKGEFVFTKEATSRIGVDNLYKLMRGYANGGVVGAGPGYATGGLVGGSNVNVGGVNVTVQTGLGGGGGNDAKQLESGIRVIIAEEITQSFQQGGTAYQFLRGYS
ncbi:putative tail length tape measure protein precursor [Escherichia phage C119]|uniref:Tape measure protein n=1 Tax=Escherichia phage C119 TaxID=1735565 RepID=A0A0P0I844_9CAUD|nr:tail length tape measure protein [Escherichia phage C119]ALJ98894.1 putative tail length tape measure protein precursor [Escherichia phage C119]